MNLLGFINDLLKFNFKIGTVFCPNDYSASLMLRKVLWLITFFLRKRIVSDCKRNYLEAYHKCLLWQGTYTPWALKKADCSSTRPPKDFWLQGQLEPINADCRYYTIPITAYFNIVMGVWGPTNCHLSYDMSKFEI